MKKEYNIKDQVWIHLGEKTLVKGRVVEVIDLEHLGEGHGKDDELYIIEIPTHIEPVYEVRSFDQISPDATGPISLFRKTNYTAENRLLKKIGMPLPVQTSDTLAEIAQEINDELDDIAEPTPEQIHAAMERAEQAHTTFFQPLSDAKPKRPSSNRPKRKTYNRRKKSAPNT